MKLYWRYKKANGKWTWKPVDKFDIEVAEQLNNATEFKWMSKGEEE
jgi:hypothetical protein